MKLYTETDVQEVVKTLFFEGAGAVERGDVENCRIRTAFTTNDGKKVYLELWGVEVNERTPAKWKPYKNAGIVDYCYEITEDGERYLIDVETRSFEYSKLGILNFVNLYLDCSFTDIKILDEFDCYFVNKSDGGCNLIEDYTYNEKRSQAARKAFHDIDMSIRKRMGEKYSKIQLVAVKDDFIKVRCYASDKKMLECGMDPNERYITVGI